ncbi:hypothetical protein HMSSN036_39170 [Paenibacillus macerans]|nr:hypothetical protein HMSSN036_39170 [Paenibacillus macerans]
MIKLVVTDLDGTFLNNEGSFDIDLFNRVYAEMQKKRYGFRCLHREAMRESRDAVWRAWQRHLDPGR